MFVKYPNNMILKNTTTLFLFFISISFFAQIKGKVTNKNNEPIPFVSIYLEGALTGTTTNDNGEYLLDTRKRGKQTVIFQFLGYKTLRKEINIVEGGTELNVKMTEKEELLDEVTISSEENPANIIIRKVIAHKEKNTNKSGKYTADFYSRGLFKIKDAPEKIMGQDIGDMGGSLDSTRSGIIYLSETISKIWFQKKPKKFKERIIASKVSGSDNGISFNQADEVNFNLYENLVPIADETIFSPISNYTFSYYRFKLEGSFYDKNGKLVDKIKLIPKRKNDRVFTGYIYIVEEDWAIYGADLQVTGEQVNNPFIDKLYIKQNYNYDATSGVWALILQTIDFKVGALGFNFDGRFSASYSNYNFEPIYTKETFGKEILSFDKEATKKDSVYWNKLRSVPLTLEEKNDYQLKDSLKIVRKSKKYLDSLDTKSNKFSLISPLVGYDYSNRFKKWGIGFGGLLFNTNYNTVQGFHVNGNINFYKRQNEDGKRWNAGTIFNYGFSDKRLRPSFYFNKQWNNISDPKLNISGGVKVTQFDERNQIRPLVNTFTSLFARRNYAKFYEKSFAKISFSEEIKPGIQGFTSLEYTNRKPLTNTSNYSFFNRDEIYETNNPINSSSTALSFEENSLFSFNIAATFNFGSKYISLPNSRITIRNKKIPTLTLGYRKNFGSESSSFNSDLVYSRLRQNVNLGNLGTFSYNARAGLFLEQKDIAFMDYYHPLANEVPVSPTNRLNRFFTMPYYQFSTNDKYAELHAQHNFKGFLLNKIPLLNKLNFHTVVGAKMYASGGNKPYTEFSIGLDNVGFGKWRIFSVDFVQSNFNGAKENNILFGFTLF